MTPVPQPDEPEWSKAEDWPRERCDQAIAYSKARLNADLDPKMTQLERELCRAVAMLAREREEFREALAPFAKIGREAYAPDGQLDENDEPMGHDRAVCLSDPTSTLEEEHDLTVGDFRRAATAAASS